MMDQRRSGLPTLQWSQQGVIGRSAEQQLLEQAVNRIQKHNAPAEGVLVHGLSGSGKSYLVRQVLHSKRKITGILVGYGKYDQNKESVVPYEAIAAAIADVCRLLSYDHILATQVRMRLTQDLDAQEVSLLVTMLPSIGRFVQTGRREIATQTTEPTLVLDETTAIRFMSLFRRFLKAIASEEQPLVLFLDDLQWVDAASRALIQSVAKDTKLHNVLLIGTIREGEDVTFAFDRDASMPYQTIECKNLSEEAVVELLGGVLDNADAKAVQELAQVVQRRCDGNPFFVVQFVEQLYRQGLLRYSNFSKTFEWNLSDIVKSTSATANVVDVLVGTIAETSWDSKAMLLVFALIGHTIENHVLATALENRSLVRLLEAVFDCQCFPTDRINVKRAISETTDSGLIENTKVADRYKFVHDRVQQAALRLIEGSASKVEFISTIGRILLDIARSSKGDDSMLFAATTMLIKHRGSLGRGELAMLCLESSKKAFARGAFSTAASLADSGADTLNTTRAKDYYELLNELQSMAVESHFASGNWNDCKERIIVQKDQSIKVEDTLRSLNISIKMKIIEEDWYGCISECLNGLNQMGIQLPRKPSTFYMIRLLFQVKGKFKGRTPQQIVDEMPTCDDRQIMGALALTIDCSIAAYLMSETNLLVCFCLLGVKLTAIHGRTFYTPCCLMSYASVLTVTGTLSEAYMYGQCGLDLALKSQQDVTRTMQFFFILMNHLKNPVRTSVSGLWDASKRGLRNGESLAAATAMQLATVASIFCGRRLADLKREADWSWDFMREFKQRAFVRLLAPPYQLIYNLMNPETNDASISGEFFDDNDVEFLLNNRDQIDEQTKAVVLEAHHCRVLIQYVLGEYKSAKADIKRHKNITERLGPSLIKLLHNVVCALNQLAAARESGKRSASIRRFMKEIKDQSVLGSPDVPAFLAFIKAEQMSLGKSAKVLEVVEQYKTATTLLRKGRFFLLEATAWERQGQYLLGLPTCSTIAEEALRQAWKRFEEYGALCKQRQMRQRYGKHFVEGPEVEEFEAAPNGESS